MAGLNKAMIIGNLGANPELRYSPQGVAFANFSVATNEVWTDKNTGERQERTEWHKIVTFGKTAENCAKYLSKGKQIYVEGRLQTTSYEKEGQTHYMTKITADVVHFLGSKQDGGEYNQGGAGFNQGAGGFNQGSAGSNQGGGFNQGAGFQGGGGFNQGAGGGTSGYQPQRQQPTPNQNIGAGYQGGVVGGSGYPTGVNTQASPQSPADQGTPSGSIPPEDDIPF